MVVPEGAVNGTVFVPGSKSASNRILIMAALAHGNCDIRGLLHSEDTQVRLILSFSLSLSHCFSCSPCQVMLDSLRKLGVEYNWSENQSTLHMKGISLILFRFLSRFVSLLVVQAVVVACHRRAVRCICAMLARLRGF